jgi:hypothetical protein
VPKIALPKFWLANILVELFLAHKFGQHWLKNELAFIVGHWQAKKLATIQTRTNILVMTKKLVGYALVAIQTHPTSTQLSQKAILEILKHGFLNPYKFYILFIDIKKKTTKPFFTPLSFFL